jgi:1-deoxy-D-xylulose-5-phosphate synthase
MPSPIQSPAELRQMSLPALHALTDELRQAIVAACLRNGGHLGASLGTVELAVALHYAFRSPEEPIVWDVGHQAYAHKLLTGRWDRFATLRQEGGISGFLSRDESEHDVFGAGHSSTALSAALAMAYARAGSDRWTVAVVGDGGMSAGVALEALNNVRATRSGPLLIVLNDNQMSISANVGALSQIFASSRTGELFDLFGIDYLGPVDGHNLNELIGTLQGLRERGERERPVLLHVFTQKGKGYAPAEESPAVFHGVSPLQEKTPGRPEPAKSRAYSEAFGTALCELAARDPRIVAITAAMPEGTGLAEFARKYPDRFFDVGIAEPHAVTFAAGLATQGLRPVVAIYSTFLQRALDAIIHDVALQGLGVTFAIDRAGLVGADGPTHHGVFDLAYLGMVPGLRLSAPACLEDLSSELALAVSSGQPWAIRYPRGSGPETLAPHEDEVRWLQRASVPKVLAVALGASATRLAQAARAVDPCAERVSVISVTRAKPIESSLRRALSERPEAALLVVEDGVVRGGFGATLVSELGQRAGRTLLAGYPDAFVPHGAPSSLEAQVGVSAKALEAKLRELLDEKTS